MLHRPLSRVGARIRAASRRRCTRSQPTDARSATGSPRRASPGQVLGPAPGGPVVRLARPSCRPRCHGRGARPLPGTRMESTALGRIHSGYRNSISLPLGQSGFPPTKEASDHKRSTKDTTSSGVPILDGVLAVPGQCRPVASRGLLGGGTVFRPAERRRAQAQPDYKSVGRVAIRSNQLQAQGSAHDNPPGVLAFPAV